jgi:hypothetical protein
MNDELGVDGGMKKVGVMFTDENYLELLMLWSCLGEHFLQIKRLNDVFITLRHSIT